MQRDAADLADLYAGDRHFLALSAGDARGVGEVGLDGVVALPEHERRLLLEDVAGDEDGGEEDGGDRDEVDAMGCDRSFHGPAPVPAALRSGADWVRQETLRRSGGAAPG